MSVAPRIGTLTMQGSRTGTPTLIRCPDPERGWIDCSRQPVPVLHHLSENDSGNLQRRKLLRHRGQSRASSWRRLPLLRGLATHARIGEDGSVPAGPARSSGSAGSQNGGSLVHGKSTRKNDRKTPYHQWVRYRARGRRARSSALPEGWASSAPCRLGDGGAHRANAIVRRCARRGRRVSGLDPFVPSLNESRHSCINMRYLEKREQREAVCAVVWKKRWLII